MNAQQQSSATQDQWLALRGLIGTSAGDAFATVLQDFAAVAAGHKGDRQQRVSDLIARLHSTHLITDDDVEKLRSASDSVFTKTRGELSVTALSDRIRSVHRTALADSSSSPITLSILSVLSEASVASVLQLAKNTPDSDPQQGTDFPQGASGSLSAAAEDKVLFSSDVPSMQVDEEIILEGALLGAGAGGFLGGPVGGVVGGILGTIIGGFVAVLDAIT